MIVALVPVKSLSAAKSRLLPQLTRSELSRLSLAMLEDVLGALAATPSLSRAAVVTPDPAVAAASERAGAQALLRDDPGLNASLDAGARELALGADERLLVMLGDVAAAQPDDLEILIEAANLLGPRTAVLAPSQDGGTSALVRTPYDVIPSRFGPGSARAHREAAHEAEIPFRELALPSLSLDLDRAEDLEQFMKTSSGGEHTRALLGELDWHPQDTPR